MKKVILICSVILVILLALGINIYLNSIEPVKAAEDEAVKRAKEDTNLVSVSDFEIYHGNETIFVIEGKDENGDNVFVWVPENDGEIQLLKQSEGITEQEAQNILLSEKGQVDVISRKLGMEKNIPLWEIAYKTEGDLLNYFLIDFETGNKKLKVIENL
ncbi:MAG: DUF5590 domain-containing protein [Cytobacillus gottheilii]|uniref:cell wall elongation regulator TseB-like domain-containing protein n=1 Tax=Cytobacillus gottheilii TaxID=859144 RepID=UPI00082D7A3A|nr:DUF5590 domain-containing protein [Cytobacillus gottheilii]